MHALSWWWISVLICSAAAESRCKDWGLRPVELDAPRCIDLKPRIRQYAITRTGSTVTENVLRTLFPHASIYRYHPRPGTNMSSEFEGHTICTVRHPLDSFISIHMTRHPSDFLKTLQNLTNVDWKHLSDEWRVHGGEAVLNLAIKHQLSTVSWVVPGRVLLLPYESVSGNPGLSEGIRRIVCFMGCSIDDNSIDAIVAKYNVTAVEDYLEHRFSNSSSFRAADHHTHFHSHHISPLHGATDYRTLLSPTAIATAINTSATVQQFLARFWPIS